MFFIPSTKLTVYREDDGVDQYGDPVRTRSVVTSKVPSHIYEQNVTSSVPSSGRVLTVRETKAIISGGLDIRKNDVVEDANGRQFTVDAVIGHYNPLDEAHMELVLGHIS